MSMKTKSEELFERFCDQIGVRCHPIPIESDQGRRSPDYEVEPSGVKVIAEVKQFDPTPLEEDEVRQLEQQGVAAGWSGEPGVRVRKKISDGASQLKQRAKPGQPTILVLYNNDLPKRVQADPYGIKTAMYGSEQLIFDVDSRGLAHFTALRFGPKRKLTLEHNTTLSAVCILDERSSREVYLAVFHNVHAATPLAPNLLCHPQVRHFTLQSQEQGRSQDWEEI